MKNVFNPILVLLLFGTLSYLVWKHFELDSILMGDTLQTEGIVFETRTKVIANGRGRLQIIEYVFETNGKYYFGKKQIGNSEKWQYHGNRLIIEFEKEDPNKSIILRFKNDFTKNTAKTLNSITETGYVELNKTNTIVSYTEFAKKGVVISHLLGESFQIDDTLFIEAFQGNRGSDVCKLFKYLILNDSVGNIQYENLETGLLLVEY